MLWSTAFVNMSDAVRKIISFETVDKKECVFISDGEIKMNKLNFTKSKNLFQNALDLVPGGVLGTRRAYNYIPGEYPIYFESAKGGRVTDVDGNEYIDMLCAYGPIIIGHREKEIDDAVIRQIQENGFCMTLTQPVQNRLAEKLKEIIPCCEKSMMMKTGSDATTAAVRIARAYTGRNIILRCGYHGWHDWCTEGKGGIPENYYEDVHPFQYNNLDQAEDLMKTHDGKVAAIIITPLGHPLAQEVEMPEPGFLEGLRTLCDDTGTVLIYDEIRTGFRVDMGGAQKMFNVIPDIAAFGKAMANGYPISAVVGKKRFMDMAIDKMYVSSTFFPNSLEQVAALKTIELLEKHNMLEEIRKKGEYFGKEILKLAEASKLPVTVSGVPWMPYITFNKDSQKRHQKLRLKFYTQLIRQKVFLPLYHHGYIAYRHTDEDINFTIEAIKNAFSSLKSLV